MNSKICATFSDGILPENLLLPDVDNTGIPCVIRVKRKQM
jgi:hypothetical protein